MSGLARRAAVRLAAIGLVIALLTVAPWGQAQAGQTCEARTPRAGELAAGMELAARTAARLDASGARVVVLARAGQDLSKYGLRWSHLGLAYRDDSAGGAWRVVHKLNTCGTDRADVYRQGLGEFFNDQPLRYEAAFVVLAPALQAQLMPMLQQNDAVARLHTPRYSMVAYANSTRYQQSNQWALETLAQAAEPANSTREQAQAWLRAQGYRPTTLHLDTFTRLGGRLTRANIEFDDHPNGERFAGRIATVTVDSVFSWLGESGRGSATTLVQ